jgi:Holliday junction DNA helicase RuvA
MIAYVRGRVLAITVETLIVDVNGLGYEVFCSGAAMRKAIVGEQIELHTHLQVKEDGITLFGFDSVKEKEIFLKLISVSGVGPKLGITVLSSLSADDLAQAVFTADVKRLSAVKGLGKKTAEKIVLELHGKISAAEIMGASGETPTATIASTSAPTKLSAVDEDAIAALMGLGFTRNESAQAVKKAKDSGASSVEEIIMRALQGV